jgi:hypothetical protein
MVSVDDVFDLLQSEERRYALYYLDAQDDPVSIDELAEEVAKMKDDARADDPSHSDVRHYKIELQHSELPKADEATFVDYDSDEGLVRLTAEPPEFEVILSIAEVVEKPL